MPSARWEHCARWPRPLPLLCRTDLQIEEATLTGGSVGVGKHAATLDQPSLALSDRRNMAYAGTVASYDRSRAIVVASSVNTEFGQMAQMLQTVDTSRIPLQANLDQVGMVLGGATFVVVAVIVAPGVLASPSIRC